MMLLLLDNYDSFTYNVYQLLSYLGASVEVIRNDQITVATKQWLFLQVREYRQRRALLRSLSPS